MANVMNRNEVMLHVGSKQVPSNVNSNFSTINLLASIIENLHKSNIYSEKVLDVNGPSRDSWTARTFEEQQFTEAMDYVQNTVNSIEEKENRGKELSMRRFQSVSESNASYRQGSNMRKQWIFKKMPTHASFEPQQEQLTGHEVDKSIEKELKQASTRDRKNWIAKNVETCMILAIRCKIYHDWFHFSCIPSKGQDGISEDPHVVFVDLLMESQPEEPKSTVSHMQPYGKSSVIE
ncbi:hypothetical protein DAPPUDRAFT_322596 [Daphnia pulex]|uniref:Uncharacterized protein n=1 Tax=Daphnia pulex TaxID=6669 RepID=E9GWH3_DAPPU|nr:hypothetical protein DAPPUDRAFT_322596 [Daphnia pulex]|eukprot:EFX76101.1 hypothetical protein DAPPUDRAFT_322596 [Daphnia pulex]